MIAYFQLICDGHVLYVSDNAKMNSSWSYNLAKLLVPDGTKLLLKAVCMGGSDCAEYMTLEYDNSINETVKFLLKGDAFRTVMIYNGAGI